MRIDPAQLHDGAVDRQRLACGRTWWWSDAPRPTRCRRRHRRAPPAPTLISTSPFHRHSESVRMQGSIRRSITSVRRDCPSSVFSTGTKTWSPFASIAFGVVALHADAFDDVELARALTEEDARRLPRLGQDLRRDDFQIDVQDVLVGEMDALDHVHVAVVRHAGGFADGERRLRQDVAPCRRPACRPPNGRSNGRERSGPDRRDADGRRCRCGAAGCRRIRRASSRARA